MKTLSLETTKLLDKMYNLRGKDSVILVEMDKQKSKSEKTLDSTTTKKGELQTKISNLETQHEELENQGDKLKDVLSGIDRNDFATVLDSLKIDFDPEELMKKVNDNLPKTIDKVVNEMKEAESELVNVEEEMNNAITNIQELGIRKDTALANQEKLNEYFDLSLNGKINITRDSITSLLEQFDFSEEEQREAAKILMFPEDALFIYDSKINNTDVAGKTISDVISEAKDAIIEDEENNDSEDMIFEEQTVEPENIVENPEIDNAIAEDNSNEELNNDIFADFNINEITEEPSNDAIFNPFVIEDTEEPSLNISNDLVVEQSDENVEEFLNSLGINYLDFSSQDLDDLKNNFNKEVFKKNIEIMNDNKIDLDIFADHAQLLYDAELADKVQLLLNIGKEPIDIYLNPSILVKYTTSKLNNAIALLTSNGMDPKNVPLMAY